LKAREPEEVWREHIRRFAETCHLLLDAGLIVIVTAVELTQSDLSILKTVIDEEKIETVWLGENITTDIDYTIRVDNGNLLDQSTLRIKRLLQEHGVIFQP